jgi:tetratricopeptide (TPR) repeat protein
MDFCLAPAVLADTKGPDHPELAWALRVLADRQAALGRLTQAEPLYQRALAILQKTSGPTDADLVDILSAYASVLRGLDKKTEAEGQESRAKAISAKIEASRVVSRTDISVEVVGGCVQEVITALDEVNTLVKAEGGRAQVVAAYCHPDGKLRRLWLKAIDGRSDTFWSPKEHPDDLATRLREILLSGW